MRFRRLVQVLLSISFSLETTDKVRLEFISALSSHHYFATSLKESTVVICMLILEKFDCMHATQYCMPGS